MKKLSLITVVLLTIGCVPKDYVKPEYLSGVLVKSEPINGKLYCYYRITDLENNVIFSTVPAAPQKPCTKNVKINIETDEIVWLK